MTYNARAAPFGNRRPSGELHSGDGAGRAMAIDAPRPPATHEPAVRLTWWGAGSGDGTERLDVGSASTKGGTLGKGVRSEAGRQEVMIRETVRLGPGWGGAGLRVGGTLGQEGAVRGMRQES